MKYLVIVLVCLMVVGCEAPKEDISFGGYKPVKTLYFIHMKRDNQSVVEIWGVDKPMEVNGTFITVEGYLTVIETTYPNGRFNREVFQEGQPIRTLPLIRHTYPSASVVQIEEQ